MNVDNIIAPYPILVELRAISVSLGVWSWFIEIPLLIAFLYFILYRIPRNFIAKHYTR